MVALALALAFSRFLFDLDYVVAAGVNTIDDGETLGVRTTDGVETLEVRTTDGDDNEALGRAIVFRRSSLRFWYFRTLLSSLKISRASSSRLLDIISIVEKTVGETLNSEHEEEKLTESYALTLEESERKRTGS